MTKDNFTPSVQPLWGEHQADIIEHLLSLQGEARRLRFGTQITDEAIRKYVDRIKPADRLYGVYDDDMKLIAFCHVAMFEENRVSAGEIGLSVDDQYRDKKIGTALFRFVVRGLRARGVKILYSYCLSENKAMRKLAVNEKMCLVTEGGDYEAKIRLQDPSIYDIMIEPMHESIAIVDYNFRKRVKFMEHISALMMIGLIKPTE